MLRAITQSAAIMTLLLGTAVVSTDSAPEMLGTPEFGVETGVAVPSLTTQLSGSVRVGVEPEILPATSPLMSPSSTCRAFDESAADVQVAVTMMPYYLFCYYWPTYCGWTCDGCW